MAFDIINRLFTPIITAWTDVANTWTKHQGFPQATLTDATTITWDGETQQNAIVVLGGNRTLGAITNCVAGNFYTLVVQQDSNGTRTLNVSNSIYTWVNGSTPTIQTGANRRSIITGYYDGTNLLCSLSKF